MALRYFWRCEGNTYATGDFDIGGSTSLSLINSGEISSAAARVGTNGLRAPATFAGGARRNALHLPCTRSAPSDFVGAIGFSVRAAFSSYGAGNTFGLNVTGATATNLLNLRYAGSRNIRLRIGNATNGAIDLNTTGGLLETDSVWYGVIVRADVPGNRLKIEVYNAANTIVGSNEWTGSTGFSGQNLAYYWPEEFADTTSAFIMGLKTGAAPATDWDNWMVGDSYDEPIQSNFTIAAYEDYSSGVISGVLSTEPLYYVSTRLDSKTNIEWTVRQGTSLTGDVLGAGIAGTTSATGVFTPDGTHDFGLADDPVTLSLYWEEGSDPVVDRSLIVKTTLVAA